jgi:predicted PurR-regulated permease PerM
LIEPPDPSAATEDGKREGRPSRELVAAWLVAAFLLWFVLRFDLLPALLAGLLVFELVHLLTLRVETRERRARLLAVAFIAVVVVGLLGLAIAGAVLFFRSENGGYALLLRKAAEVIQSSRQWIPEGMAHSIPADAETLKGRVVAWLQEHATALRTAGRDATEALVRVAIGLVIGALVALRQAERPVDSGPLAKALGERALRFGEAFRRVVFAQVRIAAVNSALTAVYLMLILPLFGIQLPLVKTMVFITFVAGLIPVVGNLVSNVVVVIVSLSASPVVAVASLLYLIAIHKLEYFLNARMIGTQIEARPWELLLAMLAMEAVFGIAGLIAAPIYYAYLKDELGARGLI